MGTTMVSTIDLQQDILDFSFYPSKFQSWL